MKVIFVGAIAVYAIYMAFMFKTEMLIIENCQVAAGDAADKILHSAYDQHGQAFKQAEKELQQAGNFCSAIGKAIDR